jgi:hypothetical protein
MSKKKSKGGKAAAGGKAGKAEAAEAKKAKAPKPEKPAEPKISQAELDALRKPVEAAKGGFEKARALVAEAKDAYRTALAPYREACQKAGIECEYLPAPRQVASRQAGEGGRSANVSDLPAAPRYSSFRFNHWRP